MWDSARTIAPFVTVFTGTDLQSNTHSVTQTARFCVGSLESTGPARDMTLTLPFHLRFGLPFLLLPSTSILITLSPTHSSFPSMTSITFLSLITFLSSVLHFLWSFLDISATFDVTLIVSFLILSIFVTPHIHLNLHMSATSYQSFRRCPRLGLVQGMTCYNLITNREGRLLVNLEDNLDSYFVAQL